jgi:predicted nucleic acid-binding protein
VIVDASVIVDALVVKGDGDRARSALATDDDLYGPGHLPLEITSALARLVRAGTLTTDQMRTALADTAAFGITIVETTLDDTLRVLELPSLRIADALYVALAERLNQPLLTTDTRMARSGAATSCQIIVP